MTHPRNSRRAALLCCCCAVANIHPSSLIRPTAPFPLSSLSTAVFPSVHHFCCSQTPTRPPPSPVLSPMRTLLQVSECNWPSRQAPSLHNLFAVCKNMHNWLKQNPKNVCVITCSVRRRSHVESQQHYSLLSFHLFYCPHLHLNLF